MTQNKMIKLSISALLKPTQGATDYKKIEKDFLSGDILKLKLAAGGGWVARITPIKLN